MIKTLLLLSLLILPVPSYAQESCDSEMQAGKNGWVFRPTKDFLEDFKISDEIVTHFKKFHNALQANGTELIIVMPPTRGLVHSDKILSAEYDVDGAHNNYKASIQKMKDKGLNAVLIEKSDYHPEIYHKTDHHWSVIGAQIVADKVATIIKETPISQEIEMVEFKTENTYVKTFKGRFAKTLEDDCNVETAAENIQIFQTYSLNSKDLFAENTPADIVLIGTSNSDNKASNANFAGALRQALSMDVANHSISGGGYDTAMFQYLSSDAYKNHRPKILIWEFPIYQDFWDGRFYDQIVPAVYGSCENKALFQKSVMIKDSKFVADIPSLGLHEGTFYIHIDMPEFKEKRFRLLITDQNNQVDPFEFERSKYFKPNGQFFLDIGDVRNLKAIKALLPETDAKTVQLSVCAYPE